MLSLGQFVKVIEMLYSMRHFDQAALFVEACQEFKLLPTNDETSILLSNFIHNVSICSPNKDKAGAIRVCP